MKCRPASTVGSRSSSRASRRKRASQAKLRSATQWRGSSTKPAWPRAAARLPTGCRAGCRGRRAGRGRRVARVALVHPGQLHVLAGHRLHVVRQCRHLGTLVGVGGRDRQCQQSAQRIHGPDTPWSPCAACGRRSRPVPHSRGSTATRGRRRSSPRALSNTVYLSVTQRRAIDVTLLCVAY